MNSEFRNLFWIFLLLPLICSSCMSPQKRAESYFMAGTTKLESGDRTNALALLSKAIKINPRYEDAFLLRASVRQALYNFSGAANDYSQTIALNPGNQAAYYGRGICNLGLKDLKGAIVNFTTAIKLLTNDADAYYYRGLARDSNRHRRHWLAIKWLS